MIFSKLFIILFFVIILFLKQLQAQNPILFQQDEKYGYKQPDGKVLVAPKYTLATKFSPHGLAYVADNEGWRVIDSTGNVHFLPFIYDNAPDEFADGLARFVENEKIGFYNEQGKIIIPATWTFAEPFKDGKAMVCVGCQKVYDGEHFYYESGDRFHIDKNGKRLP